MSDAGLALGAPDACGFYVLVTQNPEFATKEPKQFVRCGAAWYAARLVCHVMFEYQVTTRVQPGQQAFQMVDPVQQTQRGLELRCCIVQEKEKRRAVVNRTALFASTS